MTIDSDIDTLLKLGESLSSGTENVAALLEKAETQIQDGRIKNIATEALMAKVSFEKNTNFSFLALQIACMLGEEEAACALIQKNVPTDGTDHDGNTVAKWVAKKNLRKVAQLLKTKEKAIGSFVDGLFQSSSQQGNGEIVKMVGHIWGIKGSRKYEGWNRDTAFDVSKPWVSDFFDSPEFQELDALTPKEVEEVRNAMVNGITPSSNRKIEADDSIIVQVTGWDTHATSVVYALIKGESPDKPVWVVLKGNRGSGARYSEDSNSPGVHGIQIYTVHKPDAIPSTIEALKNPDDPDEFQSDMQEMLELEKTGLSIPMKRQKAGNCTWASGVECSFLSVLFVVFLRKLKDPDLALEKARKVYKTFTTDFARRKALEKYIQHVKDPDLTLLSLIQEKVIGKSGKWSASLCQSLLSTLAKVLS